MSELLLTVESGVGVGSHLTVRVGLALWESEVRSEASVASYASFHGYSRDLAFPLTKSNWALSMGTLGRVNVAGA